MRQGQDITAQFPGILIIHQKIRGNSVHSHEHDREHEVFLPLQGEIQIQVKDGPLLKAGPGKMVYMPPNVEHSFTSSSSSQGERLIFILDHKAWRANRGGKFKPSVLSASQLCKELLFHLLLFPKTKAAKSLISTLVQTFSEMLEEAGPGVQGELAHLAGRANDERVRRALAAIEAGYASKLSMESLARASGLSVRNLNRLFLEQLGLTPKQAVTLHRVEAAKRLLRNRRSVTDTAFEVGYASVSQFITTFRRVTGALPSSIL